MPKINPPLSDAAIKALKPKDKTYKKSDGQNLFIFIEPAGRKFFALEYKSPLTLKMRRMALGNYPLLTLAKARELKTELLRLVKDGIDPIVAKNGDASRNFERLAMEWIDKKSKIIKEVTTQIQIRNVQKYLFPYLGKRDISGICATEIIEILRKVEDGGRLSVVKKLFQFCAQLWRYAVANGKAPHNIMSDIDFKYTFKAEKKQNYPSLTKDSDLSALVFAVNEYSGEYKTKVALKLGLYSAARSFNIRAAQWSEFDFDKGLWSIDASKIKQERRNFNLPISRQVKALLLEYRKFAPANDYLFFNNFSKTKYMSENTLNVALRRMGYTKDEIVFHGFRSSFSTICNENTHIHGYSEAIIEKCLAHKDANSVRAAYNRAENLSQMRGLMQWWADYLDGLMD